MLGSVIGMQEWCGVERRMMRGVNPSGADEDDDGSGRRHHGTLSDSKFVADLGKGWYMRW